MKPLLVLGVLLACPCTILSEETKNVFTDLEVKIAEQLSSDLWHPASKSLILTQWTDYKKAHEQPNRHGDFYGADCYGGIQCSCEIDDVRQYAGAYNYQNLTNKADDPGPHLQIIVSPDNRVFVIQDGQRLPAVVNNRIIFFTDGSCVKQNAQFNAKPYAQLEMNMIYKAKHFGWVIGPTASFVDEMLRLVKVTEEVGTKQNTGVWKDTQRRLLVTDFELNRQLVELSRSELGKLEESQEALPEIMAAAAIRVVEKLRVLLEIAEKLGSDIEMPPRLRKHELTLQVLIAARQLPGGPRVGGPAVMALQRQLEQLRQIEPLIPLQLELAEMCVVDPDEHSRIFNQWKRLERSLQAMDGRIHESADNPEQIPIITKEAQQAFENAEDLVKAAWDLLIGHLPEGRGVSAIPFHVHEISKCSSQVFDSLETAIPSIDMLDSGAAKLRLLRVKKSAMLLEHLAAMESGTRLGLQGSYRDLAAVYESALQSMLDLCETPAERLARCQQFVQRIKRTLQKAEAASRDGQASPMELRRLEIQLLDTEIRLLREQQ